MHLVIIRLFLFTLLFPSLVYAETVTMGSIVAEAGDTVTLPIMVDTPGTISAAAFTVNYDGSAMTLDRVESVFFNTFTSQWNSFTPLPDPMPPSNVTVDGIIYDQPIMATDSIGTVLLAGVRVETGVGDAVLFNLTFTLNSNAAAGSYPITLNRTTLNSTAMGYAAEEVSPLFGLIENETDPALAYPSLPTTLIAGGVSVNPSMVDSDGDGIDDAWEEMYFPDDLSVLSTDGDYEGDGYSDLQEYLNSLQGLDENNAVWNPTAANTPNQNGYVEPNRINILFLVMPAIQAAIR